MHCTITEVDDSELHELETQDSWWDDFDFSDRKSVDLEKSWHAIHFLFTGSEWGGSEPLCYILSGGIMAEPEDGGDSPRVFFSSEVASWADAVAKIRVADLRERFDRDLFVKKKIYPSICWEGAPKVELERTIMRFKELKKFLKDMKKEKKGVLVLCC